MQNKVWQVTDGVHGTIYISKIEHLMMSTPFFYRLHDVYQSSTVYMTYPSNRTKRYEHSLGTMELAGQMFYACITNASINDQKKLLEGIQDLFEQILHKMEDRSEFARVQLYKGKADALNNLIPPSICNKAAVLDLIRKTQDKKPLTDQALCKQEVGFVDLLTSDDKSPIDTIGLYSFLYQCLLESLRVAALFHDIGHPPFSHIIEFTLKRLYDQDGKNYIKDKHTKLKKCLEAYVNCSAVKGLLLDLCGHSGAITDPALHEQIGSHILYHAFSGVLSKQVEVLGSKRECTESDSLWAVYLIMVLEFTFGILMEKTPLLAALHRIIDGPVDADRLDYIVRDSLNAGVNWGRVSYSRLISSTKFVYMDEELRIAFPEKVCDDLDDMFTNRYKIFQRINYHHKSVKTSELMQRAVQLLAEDYLVSAYGNEIAPDIHKLWSSLGEGFGQNATENQISQWTDSWLISVLSQALTILGDAGTRRKLVNPKIGRTYDLLDKLYRMLEEVQLNRKRYFPLLKRQRDALYLRDEIVKRAGIQQEAIDMLSMFEYDRLLKQTDNDADAARESLFRIELLQDKILRVADFSLLDMFFHGEETCIDMIQSVLDDAQSKSVIGDYFLWPNTGFKKLGVSSDTEVFLFRHGKDAYEYDKDTSLFPKLRAQKSGCLWMYAYVSLPEQTDAEIERTLEQLLTSIANRIGDNIRAVLNSLLDFESKIDAASKVSEAV